MKSHFMGMAVSLAILMHLLLFFATRPSTLPKKTPITPPHTSYLSDRPAQGTNIRVAASPVLFSLPSKMGSSSTLLDNRLRTKLNLKQRKEPETFLDITPEAPQAAPEKLMLTVANYAAPSVPNPSFQPLEKRTSAQRIQISPKLKQRLVDGIVLPPELNQATPTAWQVAAEVDISKQGEVLHVFLEHPLESEALNQQVLQLLHGLQFKPADAPTEGRIELYSPKPVLPPSEGATP